ncbi:hypothetical protein FMEAI12_3880022 [Parafrankia sp. Ea1.12]|nr:hypothetical protein FMEAI12_3880022 [Parafrankia sp. Ea1.12]
MCDGHQTARPDGGGGPGRSPYWSIRMPYATRAFVTPPTDRGPWTVPVGSARPVPLGTQRPGAPVAPGMATRAPGDSGHTVPARFPARGSQDRTVRPRDATRIRLRLQRACA